MKPDTVIIATGSRPAFPDIPGVARSNVLVAQAMQVPLLGLVENMSYFVCPDGGQRYEVFGPSHGEEMAKRLEVPFLGRLPLDPRISELCDAGNVEAYSTEAFVPIAQRLKETAPRPRRSPLQPK